MNEFVKNCLLQAAETVSGNGALKYSTSLNPFVDDFASMGQYLNRSYEMSAETIAKEWSIDPTTTLQMLGYLRLITRKETNIYKTNAVQRGQGLRREFIHRMMWLAINHPDSFYKNLPIFVEIGSARDLFALLRWDFTNNGWENRKLNWNKMYDVIDALLRNASTRDLVLKFLPTPRTNKKMTTDHARANNVIARWLAWKMFPNRPDALKQYRKLKSSGSAHTWQQQIAQEQYQDIDFDKVPSGALATFAKPRRYVHRPRKNIYTGVKTIVPVRSDDTTFLERHGLEEKYLDWINKQDDVNSTEYPHIVLGPLAECCPRYGVQFKLPEVTRVTMDKKFQKLLNVGRDGVDTNSRFIAVRDTSSSMTSSIPGQKFSSNHVAKSLALYLSQFLEGPFKDCWIEFADNAEMRIFEGKSYSDKYLNDHRVAYGSTEFLSVARLFVNAKNSGVAESEMPTGIVCFSDGEFNPASLGRYYGPGIDDQKTNFVAFLDILREAGFSQDFVDNFRIVLWDIPNDFYSNRPSTKFEAPADTPNFFYFSGYDPAVISFLMGNKYEEKPKQPKNAVELMTSALDQEILNKLFV